MPPPSARLSRRAAMLTPSPYSRSPSTMTSPRLMPMRKRICRESGSSALRDWSCALDVDGALDGVHDARELRQHVVARGVHDAPAVTGHRRGDHPAILGDGADGRHLVVAHEAAVAFHVGAEDRDEFALDRTPAHGSEFYRARRARPPAWAGRCYLLPITPGRAATRIPWRRPAWRLRARGAPSSSDRRPRCRTPRRRWSRNTCAWAGARRTRARTSWSWA